MAPGRAYDDADVSRFGACGKFVQQSGAAIWAESVDNYHMRVAQIEFHGRAGIGMGRHVIAFRAEVAAQKFGDVFVVVDNENLA